MTNETVIAILSELKKCYLGGVVDALDFAIEAVKEQDEKCRACGEKTNNVIQALQTELKLQEPRVMTWHEVIFAALECKPVFIEVKDSEDKEQGDDRWAMITQYKDSITNGMIRAMSSYITSEVLFKDWYGKTWRCWTSRPTDEQKEATPWN